MENTNPITEWQKFRPYNQVMYGDEVALITGENQSGKYPISIIGADGKVISLYVQQCELNAIALNDAEKILSNCKPDKITPFDCTFSKKKESRHITIAFCNNFCSVTQDDKTIYTGVISELHTLQNIINDFLGYYIIYPQNK